VPFSPTMTFNPGEKLNSTLVNAVKFFAVSESSIDAIPKDSRRGRSSFAKG